jgi:hypothetical protein
MLIHPAVASIVEVTADKRTALHELLSRYASATLPFANGAVPTGAALGPDAVRLFDDLERIDPGLRDISKRYSPDYAVADVATLGRPAFDPDAFFVGLYAWRPDRRVLTQDLIIGSTKDGSLRYHSGRRTGMPDSTSWRSILELGEDARESGDFGAYPAGEKTYLADHRNTAPSSSQYDSRIWEELERARTRPPAELSTDK